MAVLGPRLVSRRCMFNGKSQWKQPHTRRCEAFPFQHSLFCTPTGLPLSSLHHGQAINSNDLVTLDELTISNMWEVAAIREVLECKGLLSKPEIIGDNSGVTPPESYRSHATGN